MIESEKGQALPLAMMALALGTLIITPFLGHAGTSISSSRIYGDSIMHQGAGDAGIGHAIWSLTWGDLAAAVPEIGDEITYQMPESVNNLKTTVTVTTTDISGDKGASGKSEGKGQDNKKNNKDKAASAAYRIVAATDLRKIDAQVNIAGTTVSVVSWQVE